MLVDSHCHLDLLDLEQCGGSLDAVLENASAAGIEHLLCISVNRGNVATVRAIAERYPQVSASAGIHPNEESGPDDVSVDDLLAWADHPEVVAIGETGLDYFRSEGDLEWQRDRFRRHIRAARETGKPLIIHCRQAAADTLRLLKEENAYEVGGVMHCFAEDLDTAKQSMDLGFMISFSGIVTFKNARELQAVAQEVPLDAMLVETDSPWLAPTPHRGKTNQPAYTRHVAETVASLRGIGLDELAAATTDNFFRLFPKP
ncbi:MAG: TatD family hydrolase [Gammaproteobacteria bacterium]|nr:TatD family hydrolase [Gammaproteobacteria bacterium]